MKVKKYVLASLFLLQVVSVRGFLVSAEDDQPLYQQLLSSDEKARMAAIEEVKQKIDVMSVEEQQQLFSVLIDATSQLGSKDGSQPQNTWKAQQALKEIGLPATPFLIQYLKNNANHVPMAKDASGKYDWVPIRKYYAARALGMGIIPQKCC